MSDPNWGTHDVCIREYNTTDNRIVRVYHDQDAPDPLKDKGLAPGLAEEMHKMWLDGDVYRTEVFPHDISLLDYENGVGVEYMGDFYGEDGPESYYPDVSKEPKETKYKPGVCPCCGSREVGSYEDMQWADVDEVCQEMTCEVCGCNFDEYWKAAYIRTVITMEGKTNDKTQDIQTG
jgi:hypothetical protein